MSRKEDDACIEGVTLDSFYARTLDDAFWVERSRNGSVLTVAIADVAKIIPQGSDMDVTAAARGFTFHKPGEPAQPMFDQDLIDSKLSLLPGQIRDCITFRTEFSATGEEIGDTLAFRGKFRSLAKISYTRFEEFLSPKSEIRAHRLAVDAVGLASALWRNRVRAAGMPSDWDASFDADGNILPGLEPGTLAKTVLHEFMVATNAAATRLIQSERSPMIYRNQGRYNVFSMGHQKLGFSAYGQFSSPIRRFTDLVNNRILGAVIEQTWCPYSETELAEFCAAGNRGAQAIAVQERRRTDGTKPKKRDRPLIERIDAATFSGVLFNTAKSDQAIVQESKRRLGQGLLGSEEVARLLSPKGPLEDADRLDLMRRVLATPGAAENILYAGLPCGGDTLKTRTQQHRDGSWSSQMTLQYRTVEGRGQTAADAREAAMQSLLCGVAILTARPAGSPIIMARRDNVRELEAIARQAGWIDPSFTVSTISSGPNEIHRATVSVDVEAFFYSSPTVSAMSSDNAREAAAARALEDLRPVAAEQMKRNTFVYGPDYTPLVNGAPNGLEDFCARGQISIVRVWTREGDGAYELRLGLNQGDQEIYFIGQGATREDALTMARMEAAETLLLGHLPPQNSRQEALEAYVPAMMPAR